ncbi:Uncharacterized protein M6B38_216830 [Iris pallida]|uniref:RING-type E3 ubiquitin transferase n=1 Tax=Iris pallida TaxID=29817 RepID=A0AAX6E068_IRIPA|nr:Uncharacterized protein M6B38_216830 [Iris pallida]
MGSRSPQPWPPYPALKDCSQGYCSYYCPQWCYFLFPSPPPPAPPSHALSPLLIAVISILSTAFLLTAYYLLLSKFRRHFHSSSPPAAATPPIASSPPPSGLDDTLISKLASCQYRPGAGAPVPDGADCPVCLAPFQDRDLLRLLPRCGHAFHARCIDVWLRAHSTCPLCRATVLGLPVPPPAAAANPPPPPPGPQTTHETPAHVDANAIEIGELVAGAGRLAGRSLSMDSPFRRLQVSADHADDAGGSSSSTTRWTRALHCVVSPVRMKRSSSSSSPSGGYTRSGRSTMLPL